MELELIEPSMYLRTDSGAPDAFRTGYRSTVSVSSANMRDAVLSRPFVDRIDMITAYAVRVGNPALPIRTAGLPASITHPR